MVRAGERLREERLRKKLTLSDVEKAIRIKSTFLAAIERGDYSKLPSSAYAQGFVRNYAEYLGLSTRQILALFRREFDERKEYKVLPESLARGESLSTRRIRIRRRMLFTTGLIVFVVAFLIYQFRFAFLNPPLSVDSPKENSISTPRIAVEGSTDPNATVTINGQVVSLNTQGEFSKTIAAFDGPLTIIVKAKSRFGKETTVERRIEVKTR
jgi:cytoskeletal protein RodZ